MPVGAVLVQELNALVDPSNAPNNFATVTLNFAPTVVVATASINQYEHSMNLDSFPLTLFANAVIASYQTSQGPGPEPQLFHVLTSNDVVSITFALFIQALGQSPSGNTDIGLLTVGATFMVQGFD
jgi:hypothetical protein